MKVKIGLETHVQLNTKSKIFCGCENPVNRKEEPPPNTLVCDTCLGLPGSKPRTNRAVVDAAVKVALALECKVNPEFFFSRKTYFYPDMSKNFQITQYEIPLAESGRVEIPSDGGIKKINIKRVHVEEDPSRIVHVGGLGGKYTLLDYNRSGIPLVEIVTEPDFSSPREARLFLQKLTTIMEYLGVYDPLSKAVIKSDANISLAGGKRVEVKNITGTKEIEQALNYEIVRQSNLLKRGGKIIQSTRTWNPDLGATQELRAKETEEDYGYIFEPDLTSIEVTKNEILSCRKSLPEMPDKKHSRFIRDYGIPDKVAESIVSEPDLAELFENISRKIDPKLAGTWVAGYLKKTLNYNNTRFRESGLRKEWILHLLKLFKEGKITDRNAEFTIRKMVEERKDPDTIIKKFGFGKATLDRELKDILLRVLKENAKAVKDYKKGEEKAIHFLVGLVMRETKGRVDANTIKEMLLKRIKEAK